MMLDKDKTVYFKMAFILSMLAIIFYFIFF